MSPDIIDQLFSQYYNDALLYSVSLCRNRTVAEDIVSNAFFKALCMSDDSIREFKPWLLTVCRNEFISICRKSSRFTGEDIPENIADDREEVIESIIRKEEYRSLYHAIDLLPELQREVVMLFGSPSSFILGLYRNSINLRPFLEATIHSVRNVVHD